MEFVDHKSQHSITFLRFIPIKYNNRYFDDRLKNGTQKGLLGLLERDEAQVIMRSEFYPGRLQFVDYTTPLWKSK